MEDNPLEIVLKNELQHKDLLTAFNWWLNTPSIINKHTYKKTFNQDRISIKNLINQLNNGKTLITKTVDDEWAFLTSLSDYLKYNNKIREPKNKEIFKALSNVAVYVYKDLQIRHIIRTTK